MSSMACSSDFFEQSLSYLTSEITRVGVFTTNNPAMDTIGEWSSRICGTTAASLVGSPGSTTNGWTVKVTSSTEMSVTSSGKAGCVVLFASSRAKYITTCTTRNIQGSDTVRFPAWNIRIADPTSS